MKIALVMNYDGYHGREYMSALIKNRILFDVISIKNENLNVNNSIEDKRTNYNWKPEKLEKMIDKAENHYCYKSINDPELINHLSNAKYQIGIQGGGIGILNQTIIDMFSLGLLNFHPGDLPKYRGSSAPEWQILEGKEILATCHLVDTGIDTGDIVGKKKLNLSYTDYYEMRANLYPQISLYLIEIILQILQKNGIKNLEKQNEKAAIYRKYIGDEVIEKLKLNMKNKMFSKKLNN